MFIRHTACKWCGLKAQALVKSQFQASFGHSWHTRLKIYNLSPFYAYFNRKKLHITALTFCTDVPFPRYFCKLSFYLKNVSFDQISLVYQRLHHINKALWEICDSLLYIYRQRHGSNCNMEKIRHFRQYGQKVKFSVVHIKLLYIKGHRVHKRRDETAWMVTNVGLSICSVCASFIALTTNTHSYTQAV